MITNKYDILKYQQMYHLGVLENHVRDVSVVIRTSGSTGSPLSIAMNKIDFEKITDVGAKCFINAGVRPGMRIVHCLNFQMWAGGIVDFTSLQKSGAASFPYGVGNTEELINTIMYYDIEGISCTPSYMRRIKQVLKEKFNLAPKNLGLKYGFFGGESGLQNPKFRESIEEEWDIEALNANYGSADTISMFASENYNTRDGLQFMANDIATASILSSGQIFTPSKGLVGELLINTTYKGGLINRNNYNIGDIVEVLSDGPNFRFSVLGRSDEMLVIRGLNFYPSTLQSIISEVGLSLGVTDIRFRLEVSREDPIEEAELIIDIDTDSLESAGICQLLKKEIYNSTSLSIPVSIGELDISQNGKIKKVLRCL